MFETKYEKQNIDRFTFISEDKLNILKDNKIKTLGQLCKNTRTDLKNYGFENFKKGAKEVLKLAKKLNIEKAILQARSPSCGAGKIYSGNFDGKLIHGNGILAELFIENGIEVIISEDYK